MLAAVLHAYGDPTALILEERPDPVAGEGQVVVDVAAAAINFPDVLIMADRYQVSVPLPFIPGSELAGTVRSVGTGVEGVSPGDRVSATVMVGAFAEQVAVAASSLVPVPAGVDLISAAALQVTYLTAYHSIVSVAGASPGEWVVVLGAAGGVGMAAIDIARQIGCRSIAAVSSDTKAAACLQRGADAAVRYDEEDMKSRIREITGGGAGVVVDPVGGPYAEVALRAMRWGGRFVTVGYASGVIPRIPLNLVLLKGVTVRGFEMRTFSEHEPEAARRGSAALMAMVGAGLRPHVSAVLPLTEAAAGLQAVAERRSTGKVILVPQEGGGA
ncbi:NADPH:quinone oxidoreductase family protein [Acidiferrimicrobium sp. IK]|uniref:NADPH:quinone oxidoreductase family protein n=1 Tax=Acidiferrimicrobium sp. IK TaxID=2871700 RepID=UPI0021CB2F0D|nr:NADPH:quinone oxidoreductase family protein [Acidiferrimicrobium sp. IK]MCU4183455.1 NADPH:quinone oxidoreductase family protein [Acidiferrimicrobium sp. IK]